MKIKVDQEIFLSLYNSGLNDKQIAEKMNIYREAINNLRHTLNLPKMTLISFYKNKIQELVDKYYPDAKIAKELGISKSHVQYIRKQNGMRTNFIERTYSSRENRIKGYMIRNIRSSAKRRNLDFNLNYIDITLPKYCPILELELEYVTGNFNNPNIATIDRINNSRGYVKGNVIVISRLANAMKNAATFNQLKLFSKNINKIIDFYENQDARGNITDIFYKNEEFSLDS
jgi:hypothetical protein